MWQLKSTEDGNSKKKILILFPSSRWNKMWCSIQIERGETIIDSNQQKIFSSARILWKTRCLVLPPFRNCKKMITIVYKGNNIFFVSSAWNWKRYSIVLFFLTWKTQWRSIFLTLHFWFVTFLTSIFLKSSVHWPISMSWMTSRVI